MARICLVVAVGVCSTPAWALSKEVAKYLRAAATLYENLEYEKALKQIERARAKSAGSEDDTAIALYEGILFSDLGKEERALTAFKTGLSLDPEAKLPLEVSPKVEAVFEKARQNVKKMLEPQLAREKEEEERRRAQAERERQMAQMTPKPAPELIQAAPSSSVRGYAWLPAAAGVALAGGGAFFLLQAKGNYDKLIQGTVAPETAARAREDGKRQQVVGLMLAGVGAAALASAGAMALWGETPAAVGGAVTRDGAAVSLALPLP
ncbi:MAG: hypothetical protein ACOZIN_15800 [Myxococcota bacterium]